MSYCRRLGHVPLPMSTILKRLREDRRLKASTAVEAAKQEFGESFEEVFSYKKSGTNSVMIDDGAIARKYDHMLERRSVRAEVLST